MALVGLAVVPFYIKLLGKEGYGLASFLLSLQSMVAILDMGLSVTANREISRRLAGTSASNESGIGNVVRTLEWFYGISGVAVFILLAGLSPLIVKHWINIGQLPISTVESCFLIGAATIGLRWPVSMYQGVVRGLERQLDLNVLLAATTLLRGIGAVLILKYVSNSVITFHWWNLFIGFSELIAMVWLTRGALASGQLRSQSVKWDREVFVELWRFSVKIAAASVFAMLLKQIDRLFISKLLPLEQLGFYSTAVIAGMSLSKIPAPIQSAIFPKLTRLYAQNDFAALSATFHRACQTIGFLIAGPAAFLAVYSKEILILWTRSEEVATQASVTLTVTALAMMFNGMMSIPFSLAVGTGLTWLPLWTNGIGAILLTPLTYLLVKKLGIAGGAWAWLIFNILYFSIVPSILFKQVLAGEKYKWYVKDTLPFIALAIVVCCLSKVFWTGIQSPFAFILQAVFSVLMYVGTCLLASQEIRMLVIRMPGMRRFALRA